jgi:hypothetical protein
MPRHSRSKNGVTSIFNVRRIHVFLSQQTKGVDGCDKRGHNDFVAAYLG